MIAKASTRNNPNSTFAIAADTDEIPDDHGDMDKALVHAGDFLSRA